MNTSTTDKATSRTMANVANYIKEHAEEALTLTQLGTKFGLSSGYLQKSFKRNYGLSPKAYQNAFRLKTLKRELRQGSDITDAIYTAGYSSTSRIYEQIDGRIGMTLSAYRSGGKDESIAYAICETALGLILMAATLRGVCYLHFGEEKSELIGKLNAEFPSAIISPASEDNNPQLKMWIEALNKHISGNVQRPDIPLHLNGTAFQMRVWRFLMSIPEGEVKSYKELARGIDNPRAIRAAASACASNNIAILIPCHRILKSDGGLGGYRWGSDRKRVLLDKERTSPKS